LIAYVDSSVILRVVLRQKNPLKEWAQIRRPIASALTEVECLRTLDRLRLLEELDDESVAVRREAVYRVLDALELVELTSNVLERASQPMPTLIGTLDALHLATALLVRERPENARLVLATHDAALALAARANGLAVLGVPR
jgi:predicted nucleic acid-binding protein